MSNAIEAVLQTMKSEMKQVEIISQNVANAQTPGYQAVKSAPISFEQQVNGKNSGVKTAINTQKGALKFTGNVQHIALQGESYFVVSRTSDGVEISRTLDFIVTEDGQLSSQFGEISDIQEVLEMSDLMRLKVAEDGLLYLDGKSIGQLNLVKVGGDAEPKVNESGSLTVNERYVSETQDTVLQGYQEMSNVDSSQELIRLMTISKHVESIQRSMLTLDQMMDSGINEIGK